MAAGLGCPLPTAMKAASRQAVQEMVLAAAAAQDGVAKLRWLWDQGGTVLQPRLVGAALGAAVAGGQPDTATWLYGKLAAGERAAWLTPSLFQAAVCSRSMPTATRVLDLGCRHESSAYGAAAANGDLAMVLWLARECKIRPTAGTACEVVRLWPRVVADAAASFFNSEGCSSGALSNARCAGRTGDLLGAAAKRGDLALLQRYFGSHRSRLQAVPSLAATLVQEAAEGGCAVVLRWVLDQVMPWAEEGGRLLDNDACVRAVLRGDAAMLLQLRCAGVTGAGVQQAAVWRAEYPQETLEWLRLD